MTPSGPTSTSGFSGMLTPSFTRMRMKRPPPFERSGDRDRDRMEVEKRKVEARKRGQLRALTRL